MDDYAKILFFKSLINENKESHFKSAMDFLINLNGKNTFDINMDSGFFFQKIYLHACLKKRRGLAEYMEKIIYNKLGEIEKIAIRQCFPYGRYRLNY